MKLSNYASTARLIEQKTIELNSDIDIDDIDDHSSLAFETKLTLAK